MLLLFLILSFIGTIQCFVLHINVYYPTSVILDRGGLFLRGSDGKCGLSWSQGLKMNLGDKINGTNGYSWSLDLSCSKSDRDLEVKVLINDEIWMLGANHHINSASDITSASTNIFPWFYTYKGSISILSKVYSKELENFRDIAVYLPPSYLENNLKVYQNILVMHDGQNLFDSRTSAFGTAWMCQDTLDSLIISGESDELLILGAYNTNDRINEYTYIYDPSESAGGKGDLYLDWIESTLIPLAAKTFRISVERDSLGILGSSLGGLISCYAGFTRPKVYGKVGCMSSSFWWDDNNFQNKLIVQMPIGNSTVSYPWFYMDSGTAGGDGTCAIYTSQIYEYFQATFGFIADSNLFKYIDKGGEHNEASWGARFNHPIVSLFPPSSV